MTDLLGFSPRLNRNALPAEHIPITPCTCGAFDGYVPCKDIHIDGRPLGNGMMHMTSVVVTQDPEGWLRVICAECGRKSKLASADMNGAIRLWNEEGGEE